MYTVSCHMVRFWINFDQRHRTVMYHILLSDRTCTSYSIQFFCYIIRKLRRINSVKVYDMIYMNGKQICFLRTYSNFILNICLRSFILIFLHLFLFLILLLLLNLTSYNPFLLYPSLPLIPSLP